MDISRALQDTRIYVDPRLETQTFVLAVKLIKVMGGVVATLDESNAWTHILSESMCLTDEKAQRVDYGNAIFVRPCWVEMIYKHNKLYGPEWFSPDPKKIFSGMIVCCDESIPESDVRLLFSGIEAMGGQWRMELSDDISHVIMLNTNGNIYNKLRKTDSSVFDSICYILPHYFEDCFRIGRKCDPSFYTFPNPKILSLDPADLLTYNIITKKDPTQPRQLSLQKTNSMRLIEGMRVYIDTSVDSASRTNLMEKANVNAVKIANSLHDATIVVCEFRSGNAYEWAMEHKLVIGTCRWIQDILQSHEFIDPTTRPLYYPRPAYPVNGTQTMYLTITNYTGQSRLDLTTMASHMGIKFSLQMTKGCTHLICGSPAGHKYVKANEWNMHIVNHLWLEEMYVKWSYQREARPMFVVFPPGLESLVNMTPVDLTIPLQPLQGTGMAAPSSSASSSLSIPPSSQLSASLPQRIQSSSNQLNSAKHPDLASLAASSNPSTITPSHVSNHEAINSADSKSASGLATCALSSSENIPAPLIQQDTKSNPAMDCIADKENQSFIPVSETNTAITKKPPSSCSESLPANIPTRSIPANSSRKRSNVIDPADIPTISKQPRLIPSPPQPAAASSSSSTPTRKSIPSTPTGTNNGVSTTPKKETVCVLFTGSRPQLAALKELKLLGAIVCTDIKEATHLVAIKGARTEKFLCAIGRGIPIVTPSWLIDSANKGKLINCQSYFLKDTEFETLYGFSLFKSIESAKRMPLLLGWKVYSTPNVTPGLEILNRIVTCAGGEAHGNESKTRLAVIAESLTPTSKTLIISSPKDASYFPLFKKTSVTVYISELLLTGILKQELEFSNPAFQLKLN